MQHRWAFLPPVHGTIQNRCIYFSRCLPQQFNAIALHGHFLFYGISYSRVKRTSLTITALHGTQILALLQRLTNALGPSCVAISHFVLPVLEYALSIEGPQALVLLEDALSLWLVTLRNLPGTSHDALRLWPKWVEIMSNSIEHVPICMMAASSCILLGKAEFLQVGSL